MAWTGYQLFLAGMMVVTGSINTLSTKWADELESVDREGNLRLFDHPFMQASCMFLGEILCLVVFKTMFFIYKRKGQGLEDTKELTRGNRQFNPLILFIPAMCDMISTSTMYVGLNMTYASSFQMFRGSVIVFVGLLSVGFLDRILKKREWSGIFLVILGLSIVGVADFMSNSGSNNGPTPDRNSIITGDILIIIAQIITAIQMVVEEKFVSGLDIPPLQAVGWEGIFGFTVLAFLQIPFYYIHVGPPFSNNSRGVLEDTIEAFIQISHNYKLFLAICGTIISIAFFNFAGISVTKELSATTRMVLDSVRTIVIWIVSLLFMGQVFQWLQLVGFVALLCGMCIYNGLTGRNIFLALKARCSRRGYNDEEDIIVNSAADQVSESA